MVGLSAVLPPISSAPGRPCVGPQFLILAGPGEPWLSGLSPCHFRKLPAETSYIQPAGKFALRACSEDTWQDSRWNRAVWVWCLGWRRCSPFWEGAGGLDYGSPPPAGILGLQVPARGLNHIPCFPRITPASMTYSSGVILRMPKA